MRLEIEQLSQRPELLSTVVDWIYNEWWTQVEGANVDTLTDLLRANLTADQIPMTLVASLERSPVGTATLVAHDAGTEKWPELSPWLAGVYVMPEHRRRGIGAALIHAIVDKAASLGVGVLHLWTIEGEQFYSRLGWQVIHRREDKLVMSRSTGVAAQ